MKTLAAHPEDQPFQEASRQSETSGDPGLTLTRLRGRLLLAETYLKMKDFEQAKRVLDAIPDWSLSDELVWRREFVLTLSYSWPRESY